MAKSPLYVWVPTTPSRSAAFKDKSGSFQQPLANDVPMPPRGLTLESEQDAAHSLSYSKDALGSTSDTKLQTSAWRSRTFTAPSTHRDSRRTTIHFPAAIASTHNIIAHKNHSPNIKPEFHLIQTTQTSSLPVAIAQGNLPPKTFLPLTVFGLVYGKV